jgi:peroxiredoxin
LAELGQLEKQIAEFKKRNVRLVVVSNDDQPKARKTHEDFPDLVVVADSEQKLAKAVEVIHASAGEGGTDTNAPTTFLLDGTGTVRWMFRPDRFLERLSPRELLAAIDANTKS